MEALSKYHYQKNKRNVGPKERKKKTKQNKTDGPTHGDVLYTPRVASQASKRNYIFYCEPFERLNEVGSYVI